MPTIRLIPSTYAVSSTSYLSVSNASNMYANTDSTTYATITNTNASTSSRYLYLRGFNFGDIPSGAVINSFSVKIRGRESGLSTSTSYAPRLANGTSALSNTTATTNFGTSAATITVPTGALTWSQIENYGSNFTIMVYVRRASKNTTGYFYCYGAEIDVDYTIPIQHNVTLMNNTSVNVVVSDTTPTEGDDVSVIADTVTGITVTDNGVDVTNQFVKASDGTVSKAPESQTNSGISSGASYAEYAVGNTAEDPYSSTNNMYSSSGSTGHVDYAFDFSEIPEGATIVSMGVRVYGHAESSTYTSGSRMAEVQLYSGNTAKGSAQHYTSTSNTTMTLSDPGTWTAEELQDAVLRFTVANYGGLVCGITWEVTYEMDGYLYTISNITTDHAIVVSASGPSQKTYIKVNGAWKEATNVWVKRNGIWVQATSLHVKSGGTWKS